MSYCVNCGVELDATAKKCPLCNTRVINPNEQNQYYQQDSPFPVTKGEVETVKRKDLGILLTAVVVATSVICGILNRFVFRGALWSMAVIGVCAILWVLLIPVAIYKKQSVHLTILLDGGVIVLFLYMLTYLTLSSAWFYKIGMPIVIFVTAVLEIFALVVRFLPKSFLTITLYIVNAIGLLCLGLEMIIDYYLSMAVSLDWSAIVLTICGILDVTIITMLSRRRLRNEVRRRLHF